MIQRTENSKDDGCLADRQAALKNAKYIRFQQGRHVGLGISKTVSVLCLCKSITIMNNKLNNLQGKGQ